jgi:RecB family endonuclease NucS
MAKIGLWQVTDERPVKLKTSSFDLEKHLEDWIENDPGLLQSGLTIVARQLHTDSGPLDLLALDPQGQWVVIELKTGMLRRGTIAQALDYAACIAGMPFDDLTEKVNAYLSTKKLNN